MAKSKHMKKPAKKQIKLEGSSTYANNCVKGDTTGVKKKHRQAHHVLSLTCLAQRKSHYPKDADTKKYLELCLYCTVWDINAEPNLVWLPLNDHYRQNGATEDTCWPSHQVDHNNANGYTFEVSKWLKQNIWDKIKKKDDIHKADVNKVKQQLTNGSSHWRGKLKKFGNRNKGTKWSWNHRHDANQATKWYKPFSMIPKPNHRSPGANNSTMKGLFKKIKLGS